MHEFVEVFGLNSVKTPLNTIHINLASETMLRTVQETIPECHSAFSLKTNTYYKDKEIREVVVYV